MRIPARAIAWILSAGLAVSLASGCKPKAAKTTPPPSTGGTGTGAGPSLDAGQEAPIPQGQDRFDSTAPQVRNLFPRTSDVGQWVKITPVKFYDADKLDDMSGNVAFFKAYGVDWAADTQYRLGSDKNQALVIELYHCTDSGNAYGLMSVSSDTLADVPLGMESRGGDGVQMHIWTGGFYLHIYSPTRQGVTFIRSANELAARIVNGLSKDGTWPALVQRLPGRNRIKESVHYCRGPQSIAGQGLSNVASARALGKALAMESSDEMALAAYRVAGSREPCVMFIAAFSSSERATAAHNNLLRIQTDANTRLGQSIVVADQVGQYIFGSLDGDAYSLLEAEAKTSAEPVDEFPVIPSIAKRLSAN